LFVDDPDRGKGSICHDDAIDDHRTHVHLFGALGTITHGKNELYGDEEDTGIAENREEEFTAAVEWIKFGVSQGTSNEEECQVEVGLVTC
jgi:hypothetical protein